MNVIIMDDNIACSLSFTALVATAILPTTRREARFGHPISGSYSAIAGPAAWLGHIIPYSLYVDFGISVVNLNFMD